MSRWNCGIEGCETAFDDAESAVVHQAAEHARHECQVCGTVVPEGYFAIRHAMDEHTRAEYVRAYDADAADIRHREEIKDLVEKTADLREVVSQLESEGHL
ncbi:MAG: hypothetical protein ABEJ79_03845 [Halolamina sp.]